MNEPSLGRGTGDPGRNRYRRMPFLHSGANGHRVTSTCGQTRARSPISLPRCTQPERDGSVRDVVADGQIPYLAMTSPRIENPKCDTWACRGQPVGGRISPLICRGVPYRFDVCFGCTVCDGAAIRLGGVPISAVTEDPIGNGRK